MSQLENRRRFEAWQRSYPSEVNLAHCEAFPDQYEDLETQMLFDAWNAALATVPAANENRAGDAAAAQPKLVLALPDYEKRRILVASDEMNDGERVVCVAIQSEALAGALQEQPDDLEHILIGRRIGITPEFEGGFYVAIYAHAETPVATGFGQTLREAIAAAERA